MIPRLNKDQINFDLSNLNPEYDKSLVNFVNDPFLKYL